MRSSQHSTEALFYRAYILCMTKWRKNPRGNLQMLDRRSLLAATGASLLGIATSKAVDRRAAGGAGDWLFFEPASKGTNEKLVIAHWHFFPQSFDNRDLPDYYTAQLLAPSGEDGKHRAYGGLLRDRPIYRAPLGGTEREWRLSDHRHEIASAIEMGINCFQVNSDARRVGVFRTSLLLEAATTFSKFKIMLSVDCDAAKNLADVDVADFFNRFSTHPSALRTNTGALFVTAYRPETFGAERWANILRMINGRSFFMPTFLTPNAVPLFWPLLGGLSLWRGNDYRQFRDGSELDQLRERCVRERKLFSLPISPQDHRPKSSAFWEARGSRTATSGWRYAIEKNVESVMLISWNDYAEGHHWQPSLLTQYGYADLCSFYATWFHQGAAPSISKDTLYYYYRIEKTAASATGRIQEVPRFSNRIGPAETYDEIELTGYLTQPGELVINDRQFQVPSGIQTVRVPWGFSTPVFEFRRGGQRQMKLNGNFRMRTESDFQDLLYRAGSSTRAPIEIPA